MKRELLPLDVVAVVILVAGLVVGLTLTGVSDGAVGVGTAVLGGLMVVLFLVSKRHDPGDHDEHHTSGSQHHDPWEGVMTHQPHDGPAGRPADRSWVLTAWLLPLAVAGGITIMTAGFGALTIMVAIMVGVVATVLHYSRRA